MTETHWQQNPAVTAIELARIILIDRDDDRRETIQVTLQSEGFNVISSTAPGDGARTAAVDGDADVLVINDDLPYVVALCAQIRARTNTAIVLLGPGGSDAVAALEAGADAMLRWPAGRSEIAARMRAVLRRTRPSRRSGPIVAFAGLVLDRDRQLVSFPDGSSLDLAQGEFALMRILMANGGRIVERSTLRVRLRITDTELDSLVRRLRQRLEAVEGWRRITSRRGVGFLLESSPPASAHRLAVQAVVVEAR